MNFKKRLASFLGFREKLNTHHEKISGNCRSEHTKINVPVIIEAINQVNFKFLYQFLNNNSNIHQLIHGNPGIYHNILHHLIHEAFTYKNPDFVYKISGCTVSDAKSKYRDILLRFINVGKDEHFKIKRKIRIPFMFGKDTWKGTVTLLMDALLHKASYDVICALINAGSDVNASTEYGTPLIYAMKYHYDVKVFNELLKKGSNVNQKDRNEWTPLFHAVDYDLEYITMLINAGADVCKRDDAGRNILMYIKCNCINGYDCTVKRKVDVLINNGIKTNYVDVHGNRLIHTTSCRYLLSLTVKYDLEAKNHRGSTALMEATMLGNAGKVNYLLLSGADPNCVDQESNTPLHCAFRQLGACYLDYSVINSLLFYGADLYFHNAEGKTPLDILFNEIDFCCNCDGNCGEDIVKGGLKYILFFNESEFKKREFIFNNSDDYGQDDTDAFLEECKKELNLMQQMYLKDGLTYYDFCILKKFYNSKHVNISNDEYKLKCKEINELFPFYVDIICIRLKYCYLKTKKNYLQNRFEKIVLGLPIVTKEDTYIEINYDCLYHICQYLNSEDMYNIFSAAIGDPKN